MKAQAVRAALGCVLITLGGAPCAHALNLSVPAVGGDLSRTLLGDGTGVIVGVIDSGVDDTHPALTGLDSLGQPRMLAEQNFVGTEPANTGEDVHGHGTWVASVILSDDSLHTGMAPDARFVNARVLDSGNGFPSDAQVPQRRRLCDRPGRRRAESFAQLLLGLQQRQRQPRHDDRLGGRRARHLERHLCRQHQPSPERRPTRPWPRRGLQTAWRLATPTRTSTRYHPTARTRSRRTAA